MVFKPFMQLTCMQNRSIFITNRIMHRWQKACSKAWSLKTLWFPFCSLLNHSHWVKPSTVTWRIVAFCPPGSTWLSRSPSPCQAFRWLQPWPIPLLQSSERLWARTTQAKSLPQFPTYRNSDILNVYCFKLPNFEVICQAAREIRYHISSVLIHHMYHQFEVQET